MLPQNSCVCCSFVLEYLRVGRVDMFSHLVLVVATLFRFPEKQAVLSRASVRVCVCVCVCVLCFFVSLLV